jgi:hypothetical protein
MNRERFPLRLDMVHHNPGEPPVVSRFNNPEFLATNQYTGMVINDFVFVHAAITYDSFDPEIFPLGSKERLWVEEAAAQIDIKIQACRSAGIQCLFFIDIIVLPTRLKEKYHDEICSSEGLIDMLKPRTQEIHRVMIREIFERFPGIDGLVIRTGETYLHNVPYHTGNGPADKGDLFYEVLINLLKEEVCVFRDKLLVYRTWGFDGFHEDPSF